MTIYLSGKITDLPEIEYKENFEQADKECRLMGFTNIINPCKLDHSENKEWEDYLAFDITMLLKCTAIYMLKKLERKAKAQDWSVNLL